MGTETPTDELTQRALASIGDNLRAVREAQGLTLDQAADLSGLSKSHLSRLETSERQPSVSALLALAEAFNVSVGTLFGEAERSSPITISPADRPTTSSNGLTISACSGYTGSSVLDALTLVIEPDRPAPVPARHPGEEWLYVLSGTLRLEYDGQDHSLAPGTAAHFNAEIPHRLAAEQGTVEVLMVAARPVRNLHAIH